MSSFFKPMISILFFFFSFSHFHCSIVQEELSNGYHFGLLLCTWILFGLLGSGFSFSPKSLYIALFLSHSVQLFIYTQYLCLYVLLH